MSRSTLYASFGDKQAVFERVLDLYSKNISAERYRILAEAVSAREGVLVMAPAASIAGEFAHTRFLKTSMRDAVILGVVPFV